MLLHFVFCSFAQYDIDKKKEKIDNYLRTNTSRFTGDTLKSFAGKGTDGLYYNNDSLKNKITFISFWFSACVPCVNEFAELKKLYEKYQAYKEFQFLSFTFDPVSLTKQTITKYQLPYIAINLTDIECSAVLNFGKGYPLNMIIDRSKKIVNMHAGFEENFFRKNIYPQLDSLLVNK